MAASSVRGGVRVLESLTDGAYARSLAEDIEKNAARGIKGKGKRAAKRTLNGGASVSRPRNPAKRAGRNLVSSPARNADKARFVEMGARAEEKARFVNDPRWAAADKRARSVNRKSRFDDLRARNAEKARFVNDPRWAAGDKAQRRAEFMERKQRAAEKAAFVNSPQWDKPRSAASAGMKNDAGTARSITQSSRKVAGGVGRFAKNSLKWAAMGSVGLGTGLAVSGSGRGATNTTSMYGSSGGRM